MSLFFFRPAQMDREGMVRSDEVLAKYVIKQYHKGVPIAASVPYDTLQEAKHYRLRMVSHHPERDYRIYRVEGERETPISEEGRNEVNAGCRASMDLPRG